MAEPVLQRLFETPLIAATLPTPIDRDDLAPVVASVIALADRFTADIARPDGDRVAWRSEVSIIESGRIRARGAFWTAIVCCDDGQGAALSIEDPRALALSAMDRRADAAEPGEAPPALVEHIPAVAGSLHLVPAFVRIDLTGQARWAVVNLYPGRP